MHTCTIEGCARATFHDDPPLCLEHTIAADPEARVEVTLAAMVAADPVDDPVPPAKRRTSS